MECLTGCCVNIKAKKMIEAIEFKFMQNALAAGILACLACGIIGVLVVVNRIVFVTGGIAHSAYGGIGLAVFFGFAPLLGAVGFTLIVAVIMALISLKNKRRADTVIGVLWAVGMAIGVILLDFQEGYNVNLMSYLFGSIMAVPRSDLIIMVVLDALIITLVILFYHNFLALSFDDEYASLMGVPVKTFYILMYILIALCVVVMIRVVGLILVIAFFTIAPYIAENWSRSLRSMMIISVALNMVFILAGLWLSYSLNLTSGAAVILVGSVIFFLSFIIQLFRRKKLST